MTDVDRRVRYLRDCYRADIRGGGISDLLHEKIEYRRFITPEDRLLSSALERLPLPGRETVEMAKAARLYKREKNLLYMAFPIVGRPAESSRRVLCAPLLLFPATLEPTDKTGRYLLPELEPDGPGRFFSLRLQAGEGRLNVPAVAALLAGDEPTGAKLEELIERVPEPPFGWDQLYDLVRLLEEIVPDLDAQALHQFPRLMDQAEVVKAVRSARARRSSQRHCLPACAVALAPSSVETRGILYELDRLAEAASHSPPLAILLADEPPERVAADEPPAESPAPAAAFVRVPAVLSRAQERIVRSAARHALTLVNGPPGTGKSYTVAAVALEHISRGESVLIAGRRPQPLKVIERKIEELLRAPSLAMRAGRRSQLRELTAELQALLHGGDPLRGARAGHARDLGKRLRQIERRLAALEKKLENRSGLEQRLGEQHDDEPGLADVFRSLSRKWTRWQLERLGDHWRLLDDYERTLERRSSVAAELLRAVIRDRIKAMLKRHHAELSRFLLGLKARQSWRQAKLFSRVDLDVLLHAFPLWTVTFADANRAIPQVSGMFDLVIIDEATQCDLASCLPAIDRGKRLLVAGDPEQLRHVSFLSRARQRQLAQQHALAQRVHDVFDYRRKSLLDRASDSLWSIDQAALLDEHFRSSPQIIAFSNRELYSGRLRIMTRRPETARRRAVELRRVAGRRDERGVNAAEAEALVDVLGRWVERQRELPAGVCHSLGVLSPFRDQVERLERMIRERFDLGAIDKHDILVGTPFAFQGEERDVMFISLAVDAEAHPGSFVFLNRPDVFNVSITRARSYQFVFCSLDADQTRAPLVRRYLEEIGGPFPPPSTAADAGGDAFLREVQRALEDRGFRTWPAYDVAGLTVDLVAGTGDRTFGIDLIGHPGPYAEAFDLERCRMLKRAGLDVFPLPFSAWRGDPVACLEAIDAFAGGDA